MWGVLLTPADLDTQGQMGTGAGREVRDALADSRVTGAPLLAVLVPAAVGTITALDRVDDFDRVTVPGAMTVSVADPGKGRVPRGPGRAGALR